MIMIVDRRTPRRTPPWLARHHATPNPNTHKDANNPISHTHYTPIRRPASRVTRDA